MDNTILQQGNFTSDGTAKFLNLRSDVDWIKVYNATIAAASQTTAVGVKYYWQRGFPNNVKWTTFKSNAANAANLDQYLTTNGFSLIDTSDQTPGVLNSTITAVSAASIPVVSNSGTNGLVAGDVVRLINVAGAQQLGGFDFTVGHNTLTTGTFSLDYMDQIVAGTTGSWRKINYHPLFYPRRRTITRMAYLSGNSTIAYLSVTHGYKVGQKIRLKVPAAYGMVEMDGLQATITAVDTTLASGNSITFDVDSSSFTAFSFPLTAAVPFDVAEVIPIGQDTAESLSAGVNILNGATENTGYIGIKLPGGANNPGGANGDEMYWVAGKSFSVSNEI